MSHHYGRHGPHAWLRRHKRLYRRYLQPLPEKSLVPAPAPADSTIIIIQVHLPVNAERIIFIIMGNENANEENGQEAQALANHPVPFVTSSLSNTDAIPRVVVGANPLSGMAQFQAIDDAELINDLHKAGKFVTVDWEKVGDRASSLARQNVRDYYLRSGQGTPEEYKKLLQAYKTAYLAEFQKEIGTERENMRYLANIQEVHLRELAMQDKKDFPSREDPQVRDLAVIRVLRELGISLDMAPDRLQDIHPYVEKYQSYYTNPRQEVCWPDQETFRS